MVYVIDKKIMFRDCDGSIWSIDNDEERVQLTPIPSRVLSFFLERRDNVISRQELFNYVWEMYGLSPSNTSLNQSISLIRKTLAEFGVKEELIKTIPRMGFSVNFNIITEVENKNDNPVMPISGNVDKNAIPPPKNILKSIWLLTFLVLCALGVIFITNGNYKIQSTKLYQIEGFEKGCKVFTLRAINAPQQKKVMEFVRRDKLISPCTDDQLVVIQSDNHYISTGKGNVFVYECHLLKDKNLSNCHGVTLNE